MKPLVYTTLLAVVLSAGCIKRSERMKIFMDGRVTLTTAVEGDVHDVLTGDPSPTAAAGWTILEEGKAVDEDGRETLSRKAELTLAPGQTWPATYAEPGTELADMALQFPTTLKIEERPDGTYYHFRRVYQGRPHARFHFDEQRIMDSDEVKAIKQKQPEELTPEDRSELAEAFVEAHIRKLAAHIDAVLEEHANDLPQDALLLARQQALDVFEDDELVATIVKMIEDDDDAAEDEDFDDLEERLESQVRDGVVALLKNHGVRSSTIERFMAAADRIEQRHKLTTDLGDEEWYVVVDMPGQIVAHNSFDPTLGGELTNKTGVDKPHEKNMPLMITDEEGNAVYVDNPGFKVGWRFKGDALFDKDVVLMVSSVVKKGG